MQTIHCPVCRARQEHCVECRRCGADLSLYCRTLRCVDRAREALLQARASGDDEQATRAFDYLRWLKPSAVDAAQPD